ncbi:hypothetical protein CPB83DRAFT_907710 [Crepidotus variabilis]|uniref:F-box domain-containing protein n=1 Tax=Crepidotus variabilis TaxID=179855 RepID=A0A9P6JP48_9AGAR|nr:hypothetical protein CPB83DRAFT_907710 [Crepidotus variabilis]
MESTTTNPDLSGNLDSSELYAETFYKPISEESNQPRAGSHFNQDPIPRLPVEIASHIFGLCLNAISIFNDTNVAIEDFYSWPYDNRKVHEDHFFQFTLGSVCRTWRQIVWSNPSFWRRVTVTLFQTTPVMVATLMKEWLDRSARLPLTICLDFIYSTNSNEPDHTGYSKPLMEAISSVSDRWSMINFQLPYTYLASIRIKHPQPYFRSLFLQVLAHDGHSYFNIFEKSAVKQLQVYGVPSGFLPFHFDALTHFHQGGFGARDCIEVLRRSPYLLHATFLDTEGLYPMVPVTNSSIQHLEVLRASDALWQSMTLPSLRELTLGDQCEFEQSVTEFACRSQCPLQKASFGWPTDEGDLLSFLKSVPSLEELEWIYADINLEASILELLGKTADVEQAHPGRQFLPNLSKLSITTARDFPWSSLVSIASATAPRLGMVRRPLRRITITLNLKPYSTSEDTFDAGDLLLEEIDVECVRSILRLIDSGIDFRLRDFNEHRDVLQEWIRYYIAKEGELEWLKPYHLGRSCSELTST